MSLYGPIFNALNDAKVQYVVVGGLATVLHGHIRMTSDIDMIIDLNKTEAEKALKVIEELGFRPRLPVPAIHFADEQTRRDWIENKGMEVFSFHNEKNPLLSLDVFVHHPIPFEELMARAVQADVEDTKINICSIDDLISLKKIAGRPLDLDDIENLELIKQRNAKQQQ